MTTNPSSPSRKGGSGRSPGVQPAPVALSESVVSSLPTQSEDPYVALGLSPCRRYAVAARKDTIVVLEIGGEPTSVGNHQLGLSIRKSIGGISTFFESTAAASKHHHHPNLYQPTNKSGTSNNNNNSGLNLRSFAYGPRSGTNQTTSAAGGALASTVTITDVAWGNDNLIAVAGSNGSILVWSKQILLSSSLPEKKDERTIRNKNSINRVSPEAVFPQLHNRAINRLSWHPTLSSVLLSASQDDTVILWEPILESNYTGANTNEKTAARFSFGFTANNAKRRPLWRWQSRGIFKPKGDGVRDVRWSPHHRDVFAAVTTSGSVVVYHRHVSVRAICKIIAHSGMATAVDWHPRIPNVLATGGSTDRCVKVWTIDFESASATTAAAIDGTGTNLDWTNSNTWSSTGDRSGGTNDSPVTENQARMSQLAAPISIIHNLSIAAPVNRLRWRPPSNDGMLQEEDWHDSMLAVATAPIQGGAYGGSGVLALWSHHRPFMALSIVDGHLEGGITDFDWLDTISPAEPLSIISRDRRYDREVPDVRVPGSSSHENDSIVYDNSDRDDGDKNTPGGLWQHAISLGRDGRCLVQSFVRGDRPISRVPPTCFTIENLSPFQEGYGSLQIFSVCQDVPSSDEILLTGRHLDGTTKMMSSRLDEDPIEGKPRSFAGGSSRRIPEHPPDISFFIIDQGDLDDAENPCSDHESIIMAPEVLHLSRFADRYCLYIDEQCKTRSSLCFHNASVADDLGQDGLGQMWRSFAFMLEKVGEGFSLSDTPKTVHQYVLAPALTMLLEERAYAGDVQTCVALCEILRVVTPDESVRIANLSVDLVREWYLSYIDLLHGMCLFTQAAHLIKHCEDRFISGLNQQSTSIYESCPNCGKGLVPAASMQGRRVCASCRKGVGMCFICHMPVRGNDAGTLYVWCPGCGHGGHLEHAIEWFGGIKGLLPRNEVCPTGCGHRCNLFKTIKAFPRTDSLKYLEDTCVICL